MEERPRSPIKGLVKLVSLALQGSQEAWEKLFETVEKVVRRRCQLDKPKILKERIRDSDLVQEVGTRAFQNLGQFRGKTPQEFVIWVTAITQNLINDYYREYQSSKRGAGKEVSLETMERSGEQLQARPAEAEVDEERIAQAREALAKLPEPYHRAIELRTDLGLSFKEMGLRLDCTEEAAKKMYHRAVQIVREKITEPK
jgi:RNA polymerase sigma-70 factor (ECF subfamily)